MAGTYDLMPTLLSFLGLAERIPHSPSSPGRDFTAALRGKRITRENIVFYEFENTRAVRTADWKYVRRHPNGPNELYDLQNDPGEKANLVDVPTHNKTLRYLWDRLDRFFDRYAEPKYDLWRGGRSKVGRLT